MESTLIRPSREISGKPLGTLKFHAEGPKDFNQIAREVVQKAIGEMLKEEPPDPNKNVAAVTLGRLGGLKGGKARAITDPEKRKAIAKKAAEARRKR
jgi:hypothetical protein